MAGPESTAGSDDEALASTARRLPDYVTEVAPEWIDYNGHMSEAFYVLVFGFTTDQVMDTLGLDESYREATGCSLYTVEAHIRYLSEVSLGSTLTVRAHLVSAGAKKLHLAYEMRVDETVVATEEIMALHVDQRRGGTAEFPVEVAQALDAVSRHTPEWSGRRIG
ncbi:acyl-CoA thioester hydrolase [Brevibacterium sanguinis]|uniref:Acyl-CoA thioester hydrolase n=2 Tax=Brevibacterium TaxID=1696 RepID=A0A366IL47_9MICO|nr:MULTISPECIES: thioesterase family protein [Brevibacterium]RBP64230.1 acyl-CoA thioester hydrolase [Brevibacterium sanguinis]RBP71478.1 acyl-CoA thioester hydrolase [Brevibacterium celere]